MIREAKANRWIDLDLEATEAIGLVIQRDQFQDRLFAPPKRETLMDDRTNPIYDKEIRSEIFDQGTLMLTLAIQLSMILAFPIMAVFLNIYRSMAPWYISYVCVFNILVGLPSIISWQRDLFNGTVKRTGSLVDYHHHTLFQFLWGKLISGLLADRFDQAP